MHAYPCATNLESIIQQLFSAQMRETQQWFCQPFIQPFPTIASLLTGNQILPTIIMILPSDCIPRYPFVFACTVSGIDLSQWLTLTHVFETRTIFSYNKFLRGLCAFLKTPGISNLALNVCNPKPLACFLDTWVMDGKAEQFFVVNNLFQQIEFTTRIPNETGGREHYLQRIINSFS